MENQIMKPHENDVTMTVALDIKKEHAQKQTHMRRRGEGLFDWIPTRYVFVLMGFLGLANVYSLRINLSVALVAMVKQQSSGSSSKAGDCSYGPFLNSTGDDSSNQDGEFEWDATVRNVILGSFFYGYIVTQLPGGRLSEKIGAKWLFGVGIFLTAALTLLIPIAARVHYGFLIAIRVVQGLGEGVTYPAMHSMLAHWTPRFERSTATALVHAGAHVGSVLAMTLSGMLAQSDIMGGWPSVFYVFGLLGCAWFFAWVVLVYSTPEEHPRITQEEYDYILINQGEEKVHKGAKIPWKAIWFSPAVWALSMAHFGSNWIHYAFLIELPTYMATVLHFDLQSNGILSSLPYILTIITSCAASVLADFLRKQNYLSPTFIRKMFNSFAAIVPSLLVIGIRLAACDRNMAVILLSVAGAALGPREVGFMVTHIDMSPDFAGSLLGITNSIGNLPGFLMPYVAGVLTQEENTIETWGYFFYIAGAVGIVTAVIFLIFGSAELQEWALIKDKDDPEERTNHHAMNEVAKDKS